MTAVSPRAYLHRGTRRSARRRPARRVWEEAPGSRRLRPHRRPQADRPALPGDRVRLLPARRSRGARHAHPAGGRRTTGREPGAYNQLFTLHGMTMIFLVRDAAARRLRQLLRAADVGARDMAFPRLNALELLDLPVLRPLHYSSFSSARPGRRLVRLRAADRARNYSPGSNLDFWRWAACSWRSRPPSGAINFIVTHLQAAGARHVAQPAAAVRLERCSSRLHGHLRAAAADRREHDAGLRPPASARTSSTRPAAATRSSGSTCSGSSAIPTSTSWFCPAIGIISSRGPAFSRPPHRRLHVRRAGDVSDRPSSPSACGCTTCSPSACRCSRWLLRAREHDDPIPSGVQMFAWIATIWRGRPCGHAVSVRRRLHLPVRASAGYRCDVCRACRLTSRLPIPTL